MRSCQSTNHHRAGFRRVIICVRQEKAGSTSSSFWLNQRSIVWQLRNSCHDHLHHRRNSHTHTQNKVWLRASCSRIRNTHYSKVGQYRWALFLHPRATLVHDSTQRNLRTTVMHPMLSNIPHMLKVFVIIEHQYQGRTHARLCNSPRMVYIR